MFVALKIAPERIYDVSDERKRRVVTVLKSHLTADRVPVAQNGVRSCGYLFRHLIGRGEALPVDLIGPFSKAMNHASNDVKQLLAVVAMFVAKQTKDVLPSELLKSILVSVSSLINVLS